MTDEDLEWLKKARAYAIEKHGDQQYSTGPYEMHLAAVVAVALDFGYDDQGLRSHRQRRSFGQQRQQGQDVRRRTREILSARQRPCA